MPVVHHHINFIPMQDLMCKEIIYQPGTLRKICENTARGSYFIGTSHLILDTEFLHNMS